MIMNMNSFHRGAAHTDPTAPDRIMLVLTFSPQPVSRAETRQMSNGITFQLRWDMWGHTLNDMAAAHSVMRQPWVTLKSLGLYKRPDSDWGVDYIAASSQRYINNDNGFSRDDLDNFLEQGGFQWLPPFLQGKISGNEESWHEFLSRTIDLCLDFMKTVSIGVLCSYLASALILTIPVKPQQRLRFLRNAFLRLAAVGGSVFVLYLFAMNRVDESGWAKDLVAKRRFTSAVKHEQYFSEKGGNDPPGLLFAASSRHRSPRNSGGAVTTTPTNTDEWELLAEAPSTFPHRNDVLIETRLGSESFAMINSLIDGHPGNIVFRNLVASFNDYPAVFRDAMARYVTGTIHAGQGRFLYQQPHGTWVRLSLAQAEAYTKQLIWLGTNKVAAKAATVWIRHVFSHFRYGIYRDTALAMDHSRLFMKDLERKVLTTAISRTVTTVSVLHNNTTSAAFHRHRAFKQLPSLPSARSRVIEEAAHHGKTRLQAALSPTPTEPFPGAWLEEGDVIEVLFEGGDTSNDEPVWYGALIRRVFASGAYSVEFGDGDISNVDMYQIRRVKELKPGEVLGILMDDEGNYDDFQFVKQEEDGTLQARHLETGKMATGIELLYLRRVGGKAKRKPDINSPWQQGIEEGDLVEVLDADSGVWYTGLIQHIMTEGDHKYTVEYANGSSVVIGDVRLIRHIAEYQPGEIIEVRLENDDYYLCAFIGPMEDGTFKAVILTSNDVVEGFTAMDIGRTGRFVQ